MIASSKITPSVSTRCVCSVAMNLSYHSDIKVKEPDFKALMKGRTVYLPPRFMTCNQAIDELLEVEAKHGKGGLFGGRTERQCAVRTRWRWDWRVWVRKTSSSASER